MVQSIDSVLCLLLTVKVIFPNIPLVNMAMVNSLVLSRHMLLADWFLVALSLIDYSAPFRGDDYCKYKSPSVLLPHFWLSKCKYKSPSVLLPHFWLSKCKLDIVLISLWGLMHKIYPTSRY